jgi:hypothetical protein
MRVGETELPLGPVDPEGGVWGGQYELATDVSLSLFGCASSTGGANACSERQFSAHLFRTGRAGVITSPDGLLTLSVDERGLAREGYIVVMPDRSEDPHGYEISPRGILDGASATLVISYAEDEFPDAAGVHIEESGQGPLESVVDPARRTVTATIRELGTFRLAFGPGGSSPVHERKFLEVEQNIPNPFNPATTVRFEIRESQRVRVGIYDARGKEVADLLDRVLGAGVHEVAWNGRTDGGGEVASGVYLYRVETEEASVARKMLLIR